MSACPPHFFPHCAVFHGTDTTDADSFSQCVEVARHDAMTEVEPLAPVAGAAAFLFAFSGVFSFLPRRLPAGQAISPRSSSKNQANRHLQI
jgi:hypothetical protein